MSYLTSDREVLENANDETVEVNDETEKLIDRYNHALLQHEKALTNDHQIKHSIDELKSKPSYAITQETANQIDNVIAQIGYTVIDENGETNNVIITGNESFGFDISASQWQLSRITGLEHLHKTNVSNFNRHFKTKNEVKKLLTTRHKEPLVMLLSL